MFDAILFPTINPEITNPSASISVSDSDKNVEVGATLPTYTVTYDDGEVKLNGVVQYESYAGAKTKETVTLTDSLVAGSSKMPAKSVTYSAVVEYAAGTNQPMTNKNVAYGSVCEAGSVSATVTVYPYYVYYATTNTDSVDAVAQSVLKNSGISSVTTPELTLNPHTAETPQTLKLPVRTMTKLQMYNTIAGKYEEISFTD
jgi:(2Fe-2S) ferredoxin